MKKIVLTIAILIGFSVNAQSDKKLNLTSSKVLVQSQTSDSKSKEALVTKNIPAESNQTSVVTNPKMMYTILGRTYANKEDFDKVTTLIKQKIEQGQIPPVVSDLELERLNINPSSVINQ
ncbi:hypothetical protein IVB69_11880 [Flavobacterium sp. J49]|uniref:hypothetical protein n=1 Tax=Flavobacterium sp. J49 TaxID=2718534 RepID=UPI001593A0FA|nr:hypothetical protein [Flavobacterium sp. J49]MBF6642183.1 hypothetical protein [Flavobacterium sp. J49]NIC03430.1 hypothetical protein [Flavobacterium sp. J49]